ncbi:ATP-dependent DNA helicase [Yamadazyma tenuis]|uniref:ATP-dependent DNA helicase n=1 Tax=Candida tenuis TaxID=2315449 RepID=UPI0027A6197B|nr:ATP-dependent DNA helicase [Yamadazyma tenuis]
MKEESLLTFNLEEHQEEVLYLRQELLLLQNANSKSNYTIQTESPSVKFSINLKDKTLEAEICYKVFYGPYVNELVPLNVSLKISRYLNWNVKPLSSADTSTFPDPSTPVTAHLFYDSMSEHAKTLPDIASQFELPELETNLLRFQCRTVNWMLTKESVQYNWSSNRCENKHLISYELTEKIQSFFDHPDGASPEEMESIDTEVGQALGGLCFGWASVMFREENFWYNKYTSNLVDRVSMYRFILNYHSSNDTPIILPAQGLLAEEMGLGKTVEVTALSLLNPRPTDQIDDTIHIQLTNFGDHKPVLQSKTTLIIAPDSILKQWVEEILRLAPSLAVTIYKGLNKYPKLNNNPRLIADYLKMFDIVFTTYSTISKELDYALYSSRNKNTRASSRKRSSRTHGDTEREDDGQEAEHSDGSVHFSEADSSNEDVSETEEVQDPKQEAGVYDQDALLKDYRSLFQLSMSSKKPKIANMKTDEDQAQTDYEKILEDEIQLALKHNKLPDLYRNSSYESPLMLLQFWRVVLDEVQMVSSKISRPFQCASLIPRFHSWAVSGTPIKKNLNDLHSVLAFLRYMPFCGKIGKSSWDLLTNIEVNTNEDFIYLWKSIGLRHTKAMVHDDIKLPPQNRVLMSIPFNVVEQENYNQVLEQCLASICLDVNGTPVMDSWEPTPTIVSYMKSWLVRLRQICCNPQVGQLNLNTRRYRTRYYLYNNNSNSKFVQTVQVLKTLENVLDDMLESAAAEIIKTERNLMGAYTDLAFLCELTLHPKAARRYFNFVCLSTQGILARTKVMLVKAKERRNQLTKVADAVTNVDDEDVYEDENVIPPESLDLTDHEVREYEKVNELIKTYTSRLRSWSLTLHKCYFLLASSYFQDYDPEYIQKIEKQQNPVYSSYINNPLLEDRFSYDSQDLATLLTGSHLEFPLITEESILDSYTEPESSEESTEVSKLKYLEQHYYNLAEHTRQSLLKGSTNNVKKAVNSRILSREYFARSTDNFVDDGSLLVPKTTKKFFKQLPLIKVADLAQQVIGMKVSLYFNRVQALVDQLNSQAKVINDWMNELIKILCSPLLTLDQDPNGQEYEKTIEDQDKASCYLHLLTRVLADRSSAIEGKEITTRIVSNAKQQEQRDFDVELERVNDKEFLNFLEAQRLEAKPVSKFSFNDLVREIKDIQSQINDEKSIGSQSASLELQLLDAAASSIRQIFDNQKLSSVLLLRELSTNCNFVFNARIDYFKQLQQISDSVRMPEYFQTDPEQTYNPAIEYGFRRCFESLKTIPIAMGKLVTKFKYLQSLSSPEQSSTDIDDNLMCIICRTTITIGSLTPCGHKYCKDCLEQWLSNHRSCPVCKSIITTSSIYNFTHYIPDLKANRVEASNTLEKDKNLYSIYKHMDDMVVNDIQKIKLKHSYSSKVDMIVKQVLYLKQQDPSVQIVVFSQWQDLLYILATAFKHAEISYLASYGTLTAEVGAGRPRSKYDSVERFKDPSNDITCFLLNAKAQASGLNLINATHIFLCEPLVNTSLELQAISRIHRIGQTKVTTVWMFAIENSVEESIVVLSTNKRLNYIQTLLENTSGVPTKESTPAVNSNPREPSTRISQAKDLSKAESMTLMKSGGIDTLVNRGQGEGETVSNDDLWDAFFCATSSKEMSRTMNLDTMTKIN